MYIHLFRNCFLVSNTIGQSLLQVRLNPESNIQTFLSLFSYISLHSYFYSLCCTSSILIGIITLLVPSSLAVCDSDSTYLHTIFNCCTTIPFSSLSPPSIYGLHISHFPLPYFCFPKYTCKYNRRFLLLLYISIIYIRDKVKVKGKEGRSWESKRERVSKA